MPPEAFALMKPIGFFERDFIAAQVIVSYIFNSLRLGDFRVPISEIQRNIVDKSPHSFADLRHILVDISAIDCLEQIF
jgi:hypothetical protein